MAYMADTIYIRTNYAHEIDNSWKAGYNQLKYVTPSQTPVADT